MARILIIDDSAIIRALLTEFLTDEGHSVDATEDSLDGIRMAVQGDYAACICDIHLPTKNGYEVYCEVAAQKPNLPFVITDSLPDAVSRKARIAGAYSYLKKPFDLDQLREVLAGILKPVKSK